MLLTLIHKGEKKRKYKDPPVCKEFVLTKLVAKMDLIVFVNYHMVLYQYLLFTSL